MLITTCTKTAPPKNRKQYQRLEGKERITEIAQMIGGAKPSHWPLKTLKSSLAVRDPTPGNTLSISFFDGRNRICQENRRLSEVPFLYLFQEICYFVLSAGDPPKSDPLRLNLYPFILYQYEHFCCTPEF